MVLKKFEHGCQEFFKKNKLPDSPLPEPPAPGSAAAEAGGDDAATKLQGPDLIDENNGVY